MRKKSKRSSVPLVEKSDLDNYLERHIPILSYAERLEVAETLEAWAVPRVTEMVHAKARRTRKLKGTNWDGGIE